MSSVDNSLQTAVCSTEAFGALLEKNIVLGCGSRFSLHSDSRDLALNTKKVQESLSNVSKLQIMSLS